MATYVSGRVRSLWQRTSRDACDHCSERDSGCDSDWNPERSGTTISGYGATLWQRTSQDACAHYSYGRLGTRAITVASATRVARLGAARRHCSTIRLGTRVITIARAPRESCRARLGLHDMALLGDTVAQYASGRS
ncbi:unnamed protein product, partial [Vitis vinifera]|uniref:Uncharacterized protein n=1 Tax=Vitis vinifera TaxID=29760 RepID=D7T2Q5_VITVI